MTNRQVLTLLAIIPQTKTPRAAYGYTTLNVVLRQAKGALRANSIATRHEADLFSGVRGLEPLIAWVAATHLPRRRPL